MSLSPTILIVTVIVMTQVHKLNALYVTAKLNTCVHKILIIFSSRKVKHGSRVTTFEQLLLKILRFSWLKCFTKKLAISY